MNITIPGLGAIGFCLLCCTSVVAQIPKDPVQFAQALRTAQRPANLTAEQSRLLDAAIAALRNNRQIVDAKVREAFSAFLRSYLQKSNPARATQAILYVVYSAASDADRAAVAGQGRLPGASDADRGAANRAEDQSRKAADNAQEAAKGTGVSSADEEQRTRKLKDAALALASDTGTGLPTDTNM